MKRLNDKLISIEISAIFDIFVDGVLELSSGDDVLAAGSTITVTASLVDLDEAFARRDRLPRADDFAAGHPVAVLALLFPL